MIKSRNSSVPSMEVPIRDITVSHQKVDIRNSFNFPRDDLFIDRYLDG